MPHNKEWEHILSTINFDSEKKIQYIEANDIKNAKSSWEKDEKCQFEPRLLCKIDEEKNRPEIFKKNNINIISIKNGVYALIKENIYIPLSIPDDKLCFGEKKMEKNKNSLILDIGNSETSMLDNMLYNGTLKEIIGEEIKFGPLLGGRHRCSFTTQLGNEILNIEGSQYETDGCYETENYICIVEAKSIECKNFNIRQLYYPFREIYKKIGDTKQIIALFIYKDKKKKIHIHKFKWNNFKIMLDISCIGYYKYY